MAEDTTSKSTQNYELLIRVDEKLQLLSRDVRDMSSATASQFSVIESKKLDKEEAARIQGESEAQLKDHEDRIRNLEKTTDRLMTMVKTWGSIAGLVFSILQVIQIVTTLNK